jgi:hypothetical protein
MVAALGHHLGQAEPDARVRHGSTDTEPRVRLPALEVGEVLLRREAIREPNEHPDRSGTNPRLAISTQPGNTFQGRNGRSIESNPAGRNRRSVWTVTTQPYSDAHFATFPPKLIEPCILAGSAESQTVLDPFAGAGTTGLVATRHGRDFIGIEINPTYAEMARNRIRDDAPLFNNGANRHPQPRARVPVTEGGVSALDRQPNDLSVEQAAARMALTEGNLREAFAALSVRAARAETDPQLDPVPMRRAAIRIGATVLAEPVSTPQGEDEGG